MRRRLRRFAAVGAVVTVADVGVLLAVVAAGAHVVAADAVSVAVASVASWLLHRAITFGDDPLVRWVERPRAFVATALAAGAIDLAVVAILTGRLDDPSALTIVAAKAAALAVAGLLRAVAYRALLFEQLRADQSVRRTGPAPGDVRLTVVIPAYREESRIADSVRRVVEAVEQVAAEGGAEVIVVDDGSDDGTAEAARAAGATVVVQPENRGKGAAVRAGASAARGRTIAFIDADLAYPPAHLLRLLEHVEAGCDVVVGSRQHPDSSEEASTAVRRLSGRLFNVLTSAVLLGQYRDTQCGLKAFRSDAARLLFDHARIDGFAFDVELFHLVERYRLSLVEVPVTLVAAPGSTVRLGPDAYRMARDLFRIRRWSARGLYDLRITRGGPLG